MKALIDNRWAGKTGIGRYMKEILCRAPISIDFINLKKDFKINNVFSPMLLSREIKRANPNLFWSPGFMPPMNCSSAKSVITMHDLIHLHYYKIYHRLYYNQVIKPLLNKVDIIFTDSIYSRNEILDWSGISPEKVKMHHLGVDSSFSTEGLKTVIGRPYILYVGNRRHYKNIDGLMCAFKASGIEKDGFILALSGVRDSVCALAEVKSGMCGMVHYFGYIAEDILPSVYRGAHALAFLSKYEGFGLPILEAMASGTPVLTSNITSMPEIAGGAALLANPYDTEDISYKLKKISYDIDLRVQLIDAGLEHASTFTWEKTASFHWKEINGLFGQ
jgi:glycosyltransferase involved in cell wall biosynthesis